mmetsp:Transcript_68022/g.153885  ORF Transcript_68022/g.153885 Transcript_68022/m.153885 type:complete len:440 (+) Transcript_68022:166-1485(+)
MDSQRALLDSLFGRDRNIAPSATVGRQSFKDDDVCKHFLVGDCPHELFVNQEGRTAVNSPIGPCKKQHSEAMRQRLQADKDFKVHSRRYLGELQAALQRLVDENDRKAKLVRQKLKLGISCTTETSEAVSGHITAREMLVSEKMEAAEKMAEDGNMEASQDTVREAEKLAHEKYRLSRLKEVAEAWVDDLCEVCGSQISWRAVEELEARDRGRPHPHTMGSWHQGWERAREALRRVNAEVLEADKRLGKSRGTGHHGAEEDGRRDCRGGDRDRGGARVDPGDHRRGRSRSRSRGPANSKSKKGSARQKEEATAKQEAPKEDRKTISKRDAKADERGRRGSPKGKASERKERRATGSRKVVDKQRTKKLGGSSSGKSSSSGGSSSSSSSKRKAKARGGRKAKHTSSPSSHSRGKRQPTPKAARPESRSSSSSRPSQSSSS